MLCFSGPRSIPFTSTTTAAGGASMMATEPLLFQFDVAVTPSRPLNMSGHFEQRYLQVGYGGIQYTTPKQAAAQNVTVITLHQGIGGE